MKLRLLPLIIISYLALIGVKFTVIIKDKREIENNESRMSIVSELNPMYAMATEHDSKDKKNDSGGKEKKKEKIEDRWKKHQQVFDKSKANISDTKPEETTMAKKECTEVEIDLLQTLSKRREELENWAKDAQNKENILKAAELKIDNKLTELKQLKADVESLLEEYKEKENKKIKSLVKIYEAMKPKDAAQIFEKLDMVILLQVIDHMKEAKVAPILANINPLKAKEITIEFANQKKLPDSPEINR